MAMAKANSAGADSSLCKVVEGVEVDQESENEWDTEAEAGSDTETETGTGENEALSICAASRPTLCVRHKQKHYDHEDAKEPS